MSLFTPMQKNKRGYVLVLALIFLGIFFTVGTAYLNFVTIEARAARVMVANAQALALAEAALDKAAYELNHAPAYAGETNTPLGNGVFTIAVSNIDSRTKQIIATGAVPNSQNPIATKTIKAKVGINNAVVSFHYGVQAGAGGFSLNNSSSITGNVFSSGPVIGSGSNLVRGDVVSSGPSGWIYGVHATSSAYAHTIGKTGETTTVDKDAYYVAKVNTTVTGISYPNSPDQETAGLPISDEQVTEWETLAAAGGTISVCDGNGNYTIDSDMSLGPKKIACNLVVKSASAIFTITGHLWVTGNITMQTGPTIRIDPSLGSQNVAIVADNPADQTGSGLISVGQSTVFQGSGASDSFVFLISQNKSAELGGSTVAITMAQGASALIAYAAHGLVTLSQSVSVKEVTAYKISLSQSANVTYDAGLPSTVFQSGPGGSWTFTPGTYAISD